MPQGSCISRGSAAPPIKSNQIKTKKNHLVVPQVVYHEVQLRLGDVVHERRQHTQRRLPRPEHDQVVPHEVILVDVQSLGGAPTALQSYRMTESQMHLVNNTSASGGKTIQQRPNKNAGTQ